MFIDSIGMCFESIQRHSGSMLMYINCMQACSESIYCILQAYVFVLKVCECVQMQFEGI